MTHEEAAAFTATLTRDRETFVAASAKMKRQVLVCCGTGCIASGAQAVYERLVALTEAAGLDVRVELETCLDGKDHVLVSETGCQGLCQAGPLIQILPENICYFRVSEKDAEDIVTETIVGGRVIERLLYRVKGHKGERPVTRETLPFYNLQHRIALKGCGHVTPSSIDSYIAHGGFVGLSRVLSMAREAIIDTVSASGLRGRGGAGFPTGEKWRRCAENNRDGCCVICNGDEGDPGAFMDLSIMEGDPYRIIEGMMICAAAVGAAEGYIYVRNEYPRAVMRLQHAVEVCRDRGLLGREPPGSPFAFDIRVVRGGGAFVCGESTALMRSIEGSVGEPRTKYVRSTQKGLFDKPTVLNNVETFACVPWILEHGAEAFRSIGTEGSPGTKAFCLVGKVRNTGMVEVPMGTSLRRVIYDIGGGMIDDRPFKAVQTGGPSGGCIPAPGLDVEVDFDVLEVAGSMMGSGGMIVMDDRTCMVDTARYFTHFLMEESCGKCTSCRDGLVQLHAMLDAVCKGQGTLEDLAWIERIGQDMRRTALCGLGKSAPNPVLSTLESFRDEYLAHIQEKRCPAGVCPDLTVFHIDETKCNGCGLCVPPCPTDAVSGEKRKAHTILQSLCIQCGACRQVCNLDAVWTS